MTGSASSSTSSSQSSKGLSKKACARLQEELKKWKSNPPKGVKLKDSDNLQRWEIEVNGDPESLYANETYQLQVDFPEHYPKAAPRAIFIEPVPVHPYIYSNGHICLGILDSWPRNGTVQFLCDIILSMLSTATMKQWPFDNDQYVKKCGSGKSPKETDKPGRTTTQVSRRNP